MLIIIAAYCATDAGILIRPSPISVARWRLILTTLAPSAIVQMLVMRMEILREPSTIVQERLSLIRVLSWLTQYADWPGKPNEILTEPSLISARRSKLIPILPKGTTTAAMLILIKRN